MTEIRCVLIVGGGIAGLTLAAALERHGVAAELVERDARRRAVGAGLLVHANREGERRPGGARCALSPCAPGSRRCRPAV